MYGQSASVICQKRCRGPLADPEIFKVRTNPGFHIEGGMLESDSGTEIQGILKSLSTKYKTILV